MAGPVLPSSTAEMFRCTCNSGFAYHSPVLKPEQWGRLLVMERNPVCSEVGQAFRLFPSDCSGQMTMAFISEPALLPMTLFWDRKVFPFPSFLICMFVMLDFSKAS